MKQDDAETMAIQELISALYEYAVKNGFSTDSDDQRAFAEMIYRECERKSVNI